MEEQNMDYILVPAGLLVMATYHLWLLITIIRHPRRTVIGLNIDSRHRWVYHMMSDPQKNGVLAVQTIRNNLMASTLLATIAITLSSLITAVISSSSKGPSPLSYTISTTKYFAVLLCFLVAFFCNMQCTRYYAHVTFLVNVPSSSEDRDNFIEYVAQNLNKGGLFWSLGLRAFYISFPLLLWIFGPVEMLACSCVMVFVLYFLDVLNPTSRNARYNYLPEDTNDVDVESLGDSMYQGSVVDHQCDCDIQREIESTCAGQTPFAPLLGSRKLGSTSSTIFP